jgi:hypothetical protein
MYNLYYLVDQTASGLAGINDTKTLQGSYSTLTLAEAQAATDEVEHYSIEQDLGGGATAAIVFIV